MGVSTHLGPEDLGSSYISALCFYVFGGHTNDQKARAQPASKQFGPVHRMWGGNACSPDSGHTSVGNGPCPIKEKASGMAKMGIRWKIRSAYGLPLSAYPRGTGCVQKLYAARFKTLFAKDISAPSAPREM